MRMQDPPFPLPYEVPPIPKPFSDYEWDDSYPGTMKPGLRNENRQLDDVLQDWEDKENGNVMELPRDQLWQVPARGHPNPNPNPNVKPNPNPHPNLASHTAASWRPSSWSTLTPTRCVTADR